MGVSEQRIIYTDAAHEALGAHVTVQLARVGETFQNGSKSLCSATVKVEACNVCLMIRAAICIN